MFEDHSSWKQTPRSPKPCLECGRFLRPGFSAIHGRIGLLHSGVCHKMSWLSPISWKSPGILLKGLLLKVAILAPKKSEKKNKNSRKYQKTIEKNNPRIPKRIPKKTQKKKQEKTEQIPHKKQTKIEIFKNKNKKWTKKSKNTIKKTENATHNQNKNAK